MLGPGGVRRIDEGPQHAATVSGFRFPQGHTESGLYNVETLPKLSPPVHTHPSPRNTLAVSR